MVSADQSCYSIEGTGHIRETQTPTKDYDTAESTQTHTETTEQTAAGAADINNLHRVSQYSVCDLLKWKNIFYWKNCWEIKIITTKILY